MLQRLLILLMYALQGRDYNRRCRIHSRTHFGEPLPVIIRNDRLLEPTDDFGSVVMEQGENLTLSCGDSGLLSHPNVIRAVSTATITCDEDDRFKNDEWLSFPSQFSFFKCQYPPSYCSQYTNRTCFQDNMIIEVGYRVRETFYPVYESCFSVTGLRVVYSKYTQKPYNAHYQTKVERPFFISNNIYGRTPVESLFSPRNQKAAVGQIVGPMTDIYFTNTQLLSRGHLAAKTDFVFAFGERATFHYVNCAPQWTGFNGGNWNTLEIDLRNRIHAAKYSTIIFTGIYGVTQLFNHFGRRVDIYLYTDENNNPVIPVPQYYYKVVYEPDTLRGIVFVGINNPYYTPEEFRELTFCQDVCRGDHRYSWLTWHPDNPAEGCVFCCAIHDFNQTVRHLPTLDVSGLLF